MVCRPVRLASNVSRTVSIEPFWSAPRPVATTFVGVAGTSSVMLRVFATKLPAATEVRVGFWPIQRQRETVRLPFSTYARTLGTS